MMFNIPKRRILAAGTTIGLAIFSNLHTIDSVSAAGQQKKQQGDDNNYSIQDSVGTYTLKCGNQESQTYVEKSKKPKGFFIKLSNNNSIVHDTNKVRKDSESFSAHLPDITSRLPTKTLKILSVQAKQVCPGVKKLNEMLSSGRTPSFEDLQRVDAAVENIKTDTFRLVKPKLDEPHL